MEYSEIFLLAWAMLATIGAIIFKQAHKQAIMKLFFMEMSLDLIAQGKAEVVKKGDTVQVRGL